MPQREALYIFDADVIDRMAEVEGPWWATYHREGRAGKTGVPAFVEAWRLLQEMLAQYPGETWVDNVAPEGGDVIYGAEGYSRYVVRHDGEVVLLASSTRPAKIELAERAGIRVAGKTP